jgi:putative membrane protein
MSSRKEKPMTRIHASSFLSALLALFVGAAAAQGTGTGTSGTGTGTGSTGPAAGSGTADKAAAKSPAAPADKADKAGGKLSRADTAFLKQAAQNGHAEVESSKLAVTKAANTQVKGFAQQMVDDHTKANQELAALAASKGVDVPKEPSVAQKAKMKALSAADGANFDKRYADSMGVSAHQDTIKLFQKAATGANDPDVKAFATKTLPTLQHHLQMAQDLKNTTAKEGNVKAPGDKKQ